MSDAKDYRDKFDRFAQDAYLKMLLETQSERIVPTLFIDLMNRVNQIEGQAGLLLAELEKATETGEPVDVQTGESISVKILGVSVDMSNILKALMEHYEMTQGDKSAGKSASDEPAKGDS